jgi:porphobilinogen synthase
MHQLNHFPQTRLRRLRYSSAMRNLIKETHLHVERLILPVFIRHGTNMRKAISSMPNCFQLSVDKLEEEISTIVETGIKSILLFGIPEKKDPHGTYAYAENSLIQTAIIHIKKIAPQLQVITDICFCEYTDHGHCGSLSKQTGQLDVDNDETLILLAKQAITHAQAGSDIIAPSSMTDGMVQAIRRGLDSAGYSHIPILSYAIKYASAFYGPFREAAGGAPQFGDRRTYQADFANARDAIRECALDIAEGADMLMVKPAHSYLDIIAHVKQAFPYLPLGAYHTSGEYAMIKAAAAKGWLDERQAVIEVLTAIHRAGADFIITYYAKEVAKWLTEG